MNTNKLILGTVQFGLNYGVNNNLGKVSEGSIRDILDLAFARGIQILDTAEAYGNSQERIGSYHKNSDNRFDIVTKFHSAVDINSSFDIKERILEDINILGVEGLYGYMFHSFSDFDKYFNFFKEGLIELKSKGIIKKIGVSVYTNEELEKVIETKDIALVQLPYNLLDNDKLRGESIYKAKQKGIEVHTRSAFLQGLFFKPIDTFTGNLVNLKDELNKLNNLIESNQLNMASCALNYPISKKHIDKVLIGVDSLEQLEENINALNITNSPSVFKKIDQIKIKDKQLLNPSLWKV